MRTLLLLLLTLVACRRPTPAVVGNTTTAVAVDAEVPDAPSACGRYDLLIEKIRTCTRLAPEIKERLLQDHTDTDASISESGLDGSERVDPDAACDDAATEARKLAGAACSL